MSALVDLLVSLLGTGLDKLSSAIDFDAILAGLSSEEGSSSEAGSSASEAAATTTEAAAE